MRTVCRLLTAAILISGPAASAVRADADGTGGLDARLLELQERFDGRKVHSEAALAIRSTLVAQPAANDFIVNNDGFGGVSNQSQMRVARQSDGGTIAVWTDDRDGNFSVYGQVFDSLGVPVGPNFRLHTDPNNLPQTDPALAVLADGSFYAAYTETRASGDQDVIVQRFSRLGQRLGSAVNISATPTARYERRPALALFSNGNLLVVYERDSLQANSNIYGRVMRAGTLERIGNPYPIAADLVVSGVVQARYDEREPAVAIGPQDTVWVVWTDNRDGGARDVFGQRLRRTAGDTVLNFGASFKVNDEPLAANAYQNTPRIAVAPNKNALVAWADFRRTHWDIYKQSYDGTGAKVGVNMLVNNDAGTANQVQPSISWADTAGVVVWQDFRESAARVYAQRYYQDGSAIEGNLPVGPPGLPNQRGPACGLIADGSFALGWSQQEAGLFVGYYRTVGADNSLGTAHTVAEIIISAKQVRPACGMSANREIFALWEESRGVLPNIVGQALTNTLTKPQGDQQVSDGPSAFHFNPSTAVGGSTGFAVWEDYRDTIEPVYSDIYLQRYSLTASGYTATGANVRVIDTVESQDARLASWYPDVSADGAGNAMVVWQDNRNDSWDVYAARYDATSVDASGNPLRIGRNFRVDQAPVFTKQHLPRIDVNPTGQTVVVWEDTRAGDYAFAIWARLYTGAGATATGGEFKLTLDELHVPRQPDVAIAADGSFAVAYEEHTAVSDVDIFVQRFSAAGAPVGDAIPVNDDGLSLNQYLPKIAAISGGYVVVWQDERNGNWDIYGSLIQTGETTAGVNYLVNDAEVTDQTVPSIAAVRTSNEPFICWEDLRQITTAPDIYGNRNAAAVTAGVGDDSGPSRPERFTLAQNFPNPFNPATEIRYALPAPGVVRLVIYNTLGQRVRTLIDGLQSAGAQRAVWDGRDQAGQPVASGVYFYRLHWPEGEITRRMTLLR